ncbi:hypothetical protein D1871_08610 [Nakamurella silvestris]|nr:hypothetical protein D1871_08610 [Nakamurella silvestris]
MVAQRRATASRSALPAALITATWLFTGCTTPTDISGSTGAGTTRAASSAASSVPTRSTPVTADPTTPSSAPTVPTETGVVTPREPGITRSFGGPGSKVVRTDFSDAQTVFWDWGGDERSGKSADGTRWYRFADGSESFWTDVGNVYTALDGTKSLCAWSGPCADLPGGWPRAIDRHHPAVAAQVLGGRITGDPHIQTQDGTAFSTQLVGEFVAREGDDGHDIQVRTVPMPGRTDVSLVGAVAVSTGDHRITVTSHPTVEVRIDGKLQKPPEEFTQVDLSDDATVGVWAAGSREDMSQRLFTVAVLWPDLSDVHLFVSPVYGITMATQWPEGSSARGLLGDANGEVADDLTIRGGALTLNSEIFAESWRIAAEESLFDYRDGENTETWTQLAFPFTDAAAIAGVRREAEQSCAAIGSSNRHALDACIFDVSVTGDPGFVLGHHLLADVAKGYQRDLRLASWLDQQTGNFPGADLSLTQEDIAGARSLADDGRVDITVKAGRSHTVTFTVDARTTVRIAGNDTSCLEQPIGVGEAGYQLFRADGTPVSAAWSPCSEGLGTQVPPGEYYLKFAGADAGNRTDFDVTVHLG